MKTPKKPSLLKKLKQSSSQKNDSTALKAPPRVTNNTVTDYRDEILSKAKKFKYPFYRSKHKIALPGASHEFFHFQLQRLKVRLCRMKAIFSN